MRSSQRDVHLDLREASHCSFRARAPVCVLLTKRPAGTAKSDILAWRRKGIRIGAPVLFYSTPLNLGAPRAQIRGYWCQEIPVRATRVDRHTRENL